MNERDALDRYLRELEPHGDGEVISSLMACIRDARNVTGRKEQDGTIVHGRHTGTWLGAFGYLTALDQIGTAVTIAGSAIPSDVKNGIERALRDFAPELNDADRKGIRALRNAMLHNFSLIDRKHKPYRRFKLKANATDPLIRHPTREWTDFDDDADDARTIVNLEQLGNLVERVVERVQQHHQAGRLKNRFQTSKELAVRYTITMIPGDP